MEDYRYCPACGAPLTRQRAFGKLRPVCTRCGRVHFREPKVAAAVFIKWDDRVLLVRRVHDSERGRWSLPAGFVDAGEDPRQAAAREVLEETGLEVEITALLEVLHAGEHQGGADIVIVYAGEVVAGDLMAGDDVDSAKFFAAHELPRLAFESTRQVLADWADG